MLSYQHAYHAGGPADLHKHAAMCVLIERLAEKPKPFAVVDLYAGHGVYGLGTDEAQKTKEFEGGIGRLWPKRAQPAPQAISALFGAIAPLNPEGRLIYYPGSPAIARAFMREGDLLILNELHPAAHTDLKRWARQDDRITLHKRDGLEALVGLMPPPVRRGLVVIDPSYEIKTEYGALPEALRKAQRKWKEGTYLVWYPILADGRHSELVKGLETDLTGGVIACELHFDASKFAKDTPGLRGTGVIVVNPPWKFDDAMGAAGEWLAKTLTTTGRHTLRWLQRDANVA